MKWPNFRGSLDGMPWFGMVKGVTKNDETSEKIVPLLPPMAVFPPGKRPEPYEIVDPEGDLALWDPSGKRWLRIKGGGTPTLSGVVMEAIHRTPDVTSDPADYVYGKIRVLGDESGTQYDCACLMLAKDPEGGNHQQLIKGDQVALHGPYQRDNPAYEKENTESNEPEKIEYYLADVIMEYRIKLDFDVLWDMEADPPTAGNSTITRKDSDGIDVVMFVSGEVVSQGFKVTGNAEAYLVRNEKSEDGRRLFVVGGRCQQKVT